MNPLLAASKPVFENEQFLNVTSGNVTFTPADILYMKGLILKEISLVAWVCLIIGFAFGALAVYFYYRRKYGST
jgi:hypothetical protein